ncbi:MAG: alkaline phosphatase D family protein [Bacteroidales bacterium]
MKPYAVTGFLILLAYSCNKKETSEGPYFGNGYHNGWADQHSIVIWTRLTAIPDLNLEGAPFIALTGDRHEKLRHSGNRDSIHMAQIPDTLSLAEMEGACPGAPGQVRLLYFPMDDPGQRVETGWDPVDPALNYTRQWRLAGLKEDTRYRVEIFARRGPEYIISDTIRGTFITPPGADSLREVRFCIVTGHDYNRRDDSLKGHKIYPAMLGTVPDFYVHTGDIEYYDKPNPWAMTETLMRFKWDRLFALPYQRQFFTEVTTYFIKDDHDALCNDTYRGMQYGTVSFERGIGIFDREQFPSNPKPYKTIRWGRDLQIWLMEGRNFRSPNFLPDGPEKTIWGEEQKAWFFRTIDASDATFKLVISPTPILGPDRENKHDNHANDAFSHEGDEIRNFINRHQNIFICSGDRHWQYVTHWKGTSLWEFSCGPGSDVHAGGWDPEDVRLEHRFLRVKGGFLAGKVTRMGGRALLLFQHCDVEGNVVHEEMFEVRL